jgi:hypothetical protein
MPLGLEAIFFHRTCDMLAHQRLRREGARLPGRPQPFMPLKHLAAATIDPSRSSDAHHNESLFAIGLLMKSVDP